MALADRLGLVKDGEAGAGNGAASNGGSTAASTPPHDRGSSSTASAQQTTTTTTTTGGTSIPVDPDRDANKYRQFRIVEDHVTTALRGLIAETTEDSLAGTNMTMMAGALSLALTYIHKRAMPIEDTTLAGTLQAAGGVAHTSGDGAAGGTGGGKKDDLDMSMNARILVISVSGDLAEQYIPIMNCIFAAQRKVRQPFPHTHTHTHTSSLLSYIYIYIYIYNCMGLIIAFFPPLFLFYLFLPGKG